MSSIVVSCWYLILVYSVESYEYGYHPSSEEFDSQMREKTWTRDLLWKEKNIRTFSPKFNLQKPKGNDPEQRPHFVGSASENKNKFLGYAEIENDTIALPSESVAEISVNSFVDETSNFHNHSIFPIYFTNPTTGIVYAISEVGVDTGHMNVSGGNGSIPIFVSKEQYERDLYLLKKSYESKCTRQGTPEIIKLNGGKVDNRPVKVKTKLTVETNQTHVNGVRKRKNRHRKAKKRKTLQKNKKVQNKHTHPSDPLPALDTQLEKPNKVNTSSVFSSSPLIRRRVNSTFNKSSRKPQSTKGVIHKVVRRSLNFKKESISNTKIAKSLTTVQNSTSLVDKPKKILSTQIQVTSEYLEPPPLKTRTPKNSIEENSHTELPQKAPSPPCQKPGTAKETVDDEDYEDYYDFDGAAYSDDQSDLVDSDDDESDESSEEKESLEENISDYNLAETMQQEDGKYQPKEDTKKRIKRRRPYNDEYDDYDDDYDNESDDGVLGLFRGLFTPVQWVMDSIFDRAALMFSKEPESESNYNRKPKYPQYTVYNSGANEVGGEEHVSSDNKGNSFGTWLGSWFGLRKRRGVSTTPPTPAEDEPGWLESWFGHDVRTPTPDEEESDPWFFGWFNSKPRTKRTTTTTTTTPTPILTIAEPLKNPHKWIGLLAQHIVNSTSTLNPITETTTYNPDVPKKIFYDKYQIWRLKPTDNSQVKVLEEYKRSEEGVRMQWLMGPSLRGFTDVLIPPKLLVDFQGTLNFEDISHEILIFDVGKVIAYEETKQDDMIPKKPGAGKPVMSWNKYYDYDSIIKYLELTQLRNPEFVELIHIGRSFEGRPLVIAKLEMKKHKDKVTTKKKMKLNKKSDQANSVFIEAGVHGREWISPAAATWIINELLRTMKNNRTNLETEYIKNTTWYIMPLSNPDSYEYSHQYDRFWKKSRSRHIAKPNGIINSAMTWLKKKNSEKVCFGVDLDCNWHYNWGKRGSSKSPCNEFFSGPTPFSEPETRALSKFLMDNRKQIKLFISLQAYGQIISYPNKLNSSFQSQKLDDLLDVAMVGTDGLRKRGSKSRYKVDSMNDLIESKSGSSYYFATFEVGIPFTYTIYLADNGVHGFLLPSTYIEPTARDAFEIISAMIDYI